MRLASGSGAFFQEGEGQRADGQEKIRRFRHGAPDDTIAELKLKIVREPKRLRSNYLIEGGLVEDK